GLTATAAAQQANGNGGGMMTGVGMNGGGCAGGGCAAGATAAGSCGGHCLPIHCPPALHHCQEGPPCIKFHCGCPRPVCCPCDQPNWGYFQTCWRPWPWPPNYSHCAVPGPQAFIPHGVPQEYHTLPTTPEGPAPRKLERPSP